MFILCNCRIINTNVYKLENESNFSKLHTFKTKCLKNYLAYFKSTHLNNFYFVI